MSRNRIKFYEIGEYFSQKPKEMFLLTYDLTKKAS